MNIAEGKKEAAEVLPKFGYEIDCCNDESPYSTPFLRCTNGQYIEVAHTQHDCAFEDGIREKSPVLRKYSIDYIVYEICKEKGKYNAEKDIDLFVYITQIEQGMLLDVLTNPLRKPEKHQFFDKINASHYGKIFLCEWDIDEDKYIENPRVVVLTPNKEREKYEFIDFSRGSIRCVNIKG